MSRTRLRLASQRLLAPAGLPRIRLHDLRHTMATRILAQGEHPKVVSERLGHATVGITLDTYSPRPLGGVSGRLVDPLESDKPDNN